MSVLQAHDLAIAEPLDPQNSGSGQKSEESGFKDVGCVFHVHSPCTATPGTLTFQATRMAPMQKLSFNGLVMYLMFFTASSFLVASVFC